MNSEKGMVSKIKDGFERQVGNKFRRSLKEVQVSADEYKLIRSSMISSNDENLLKVKQSKTTEKVIVSEKENAMTVRRSKRRNVAEKVNYLESPVEIKPSKSRITQTKKSAVKSKKGRSVAANKSEQTTLDQSKINFPPVKANTTSESSSASQSDNLEKKIKDVTALTEIGEDSGIDPNCGTSDQSPLNSTAISRTFDVKRLPAIPCDMVSLITADSPPLNYWKDLAEQRRKALDEALHENELLHDQLEVLEAENSQLKELLKGAEKLAEVVRAIVD